VSDRLRFTRLGCGSSGGVPRADGVWGRCDPLEPKNRRSRCSLLVQRPNDDPQGPETTALIDTSPDLRYQTSAAGVTRIDAVLYTHDHADQTHGIDDLRVFFLTSRRRTPCFMDAATAKTLGARFDYIFDTRNGYPAICDLHRLPPHHTPWSVEGPSGPIPILTFDQDHGPIRSVGYRVGGLAYCSDVVAFPESALPALEGLDVLIVDALRDAPHPTHATVEQALAWIEALKPSRAILTNMHGDLDYAELSARLPGGVEAAYDGMVIETPLVTGTAAT
jgi:phosphoribosyl 1,2-cyclic phosphate phosphodiesterase